jgi:predicted ATPase/DNA-binding SARP family transcriptional activator
LIVSPHELNRSSSGFELRLFGPFAMLTDGKPLSSLRTRKGQSLLALLVLRAGRAVERPWLAGTIWPDSPEAQALYNLRRTLSDLRHVLGPEASRLGVGQQPHTLALDLRGATVDVVAFDEAIERGDVLTAASLYKGPLLEGCLEEWVVPERESRERALSNALETLARDASLRGDWSAAERYLRRAVDLDPLRETVQRALMETLASAGTPAAALQCFRDLRLLLARELKADPAPETSAVIRRIRADARRQLQPSRPPRAMAPPSRARLGNLPRPRTTFLGREQEIDAVERRLEPSRVLTLTGAGGVGKTRLAIRVGEDVAADHDDGVWFVDLAPLADGEGIVRAVATVLRVREEPNRSLIDTLCSFLAEKNLLLILDTCEHLASSCATFAETLLLGCSRLKLCTTSRQALGVSGEVICRVPSLSLPRATMLHSGATTLVSDIMESEAIRLFVARATESFPEFKITAGNARTVAEICTRLDGIPLAIELAAARTRVLSVEQIATRLHDRFRLLTDGRRMTLPRQQTLRATLDWSYELLGTKEQLFLQRLSSFTGEATLGAAEAVCSGGVIEPDDILDLMTVLIDRSLVALKTQGEGESRYALLETIRQYGQDLLEQSGESLEVRHRHARFFLQFAIEAEEHMSGPAQAEWLGRLEAEYNNLRAALALFIEREPVRALELALVLKPFWEVRAHFVEGRGWLERALKHSRDVPSVLRARALGVAGRLAWYQEDFPGAQALLNESLGLLDALGERRSAVVVLGDLGQLAVAEGDYVRARSLCERAVAEARTLGDKQVLAGQLLSLEMVAGTCLDIATVRVVDEEALALCHEVGDQRGVAHVLMSLGLADVYSGDEVRARGRFLESLALSRVLGDSWLICGVLLGLGHADKARGDFASAHGNYAQGLRLYRESNSNWGVHLFEALAALAAAEGRVARATRLLGAAEALREARRLPLFPFLRPEHDRAVAVAQAGLDPGAFTMAWTEGRTLPLDRAVELAVTRDE